MTKDIAKHLNAPMTHLLIECQECDPGILEAEEALSDLLSELVFREDRPVMDFLFHQFRPSGVTGFVMTSGSRANIHTWPEKQYASADLCTEDDVVASQIVEKMRVGLRAKNVQVVECKRGNHQSMQMEIANYRRVPVRQIDLRGAIPNGVRLDTSLNRGFGLFAVRDFSPGELIYVAAGEQVGWDAELIIETDLGRTTHSGDSYGYEISIVWAKNWPPQIREAIANHYQLQNPTIDELVASVTADEEFNTIITGIDGLGNHSRNCNAQLQWSEASLEFDESDRPVWAIPLRAIRPIQAGQELLQDYNHTLLDFIPPSDWDD